MSQTSPPESKPQSGEPTPASALGARSEPQASEARTNWSFWIDRGGTFTDCIARAPDGALHTHKRLSSETAPVEAIEAVLEEVGAWRRGGPLPPCTVKLGTTVATNALLERRGVPTLLVTTRGLGDLLAIGTQERPELFELEIRKPAPLAREVVECDGRLGADGESLDALDEDALRARLAEARSRGLHSLAVAGLHAYLDPAVEERVVALAREAGFAYSVASSEIAREQGLLARAETACADAYLTPLLRSHVDGLREALPGSRLRFMQSSGGLTDGDHFRGPRALLSGPAGGVVGAARIAGGAGFPRAIGFDMGGTSTDVSLIDGAELERAFETKVAGIRVRSPMLRIHTVAAGGGSLCRFDGFRLTVGPESAGAIPGPLCYGAPEARDLAVTDVNYFLGRIRADRFPFPLHRAPVEAAFARLGRELARAGLPRSEEELAAGFLEIANASMAQAIQEVSVGRGVDPRDFALVGFGGAAGQHVCAVARRLGIRTVLLHPLAGLLSAYGIGVAELSCDRQRDAGRLLLDPESGAAPESCLGLLAELEAEARAVLAAEGAPARAVRVEHLLDLRVRGTEAPLTVPSPGAGGNWLAAYGALHQSRFGYTRPGRPVEVVTARARAVAPEPVPSLPFGGRGGEPRALREERAWFPGAGWTEAPLYDRDTLPEGAELVGPAVLLEGTGTVVLDPAFHARVGEGGLLVLTDTGLAKDERRDDLGVADPVRLEVFGNRFMSIAEQMGAVLRNTSVSTNIKERLDYSCAVFDREGGLVANAPHIPVHLGAMGATVRAVQEAIPALGPGDAVVTNDPSRGGSHLPDVTVVTPVFAEGGLRFFVASRGHHADLGGKTPGSMPADSSTLEEEGVVLEPFALVRAGAFDEAGLRRRLGEARYPARNPDDNVADLEAMVAANRSGEALLERMVEEAGLEAVQITMAQLQGAAAGKVAREIGRLADGAHRFEDRMDDGTPLCVNLEVAGDRMTIDFEGTGPASEGNLNAPRAVVESAVLYVLRALVAERIPLNGGCLGPVRIRIPEGSLLDPPPGRAVVGGNVETSQRVVDVLLGAIGEVAASQGTMNNLAFGDESFGYYETLGGGAGAGRGFEGASGVHSHMTNTRITDPEILESRYPVRLRRFALRSRSGGAGQWSGGEGLVRELEFTAPVTVSLLTERRTVAPYGLAGGEAGQPGSNRVLRADGRAEDLPGRASVEFRPGDRLLVATPGGGGFGPIT
ncbi:MAG: hydantoinase B/oxoprolinase family protein [Planctomycetota bacterium]|jgi:5-oxoprolinase (ATP-hydrolysing)|nr:hydantoinase B/oxoprolinase family protein [Planctomycetota bacterium]